MQNRQWNMRINLKEIVGLQDHHQISGLENSARLFRNSVIFWYLLSTVFLRHLHTSVLQKDFTFKHSMNGLHHLHYKDVTSYDTSYNVLFGLMKLYIKTVVMVSVWNWTTKHVICCPCNLIVTSGFAVEISIESLHEDHKSK